MDINFTWTINDLHSLSNSGGVVKAMWQCRGYTDSDSKTVLGETTFEPNKNDPDFIKYQDLLEDDVIGWIWASEENFKAEIENSIEARMNNELPQYEINGMPWDASNLTIKAEVVE